MVIQRLLQVCNRVIDLSFQFDPNGHLNKVGEWPYGFTPIATALAALVTQLFLGFR